MGYPAAEKLEDIRVVERSHLLAKRTFEMCLASPKTSFYRWYDRYKAFGDSGLADRRPRPGRVWNRIPDEIREAVVDLALDKSELSLRELTFEFTDTTRHFVSEATVYRILKAQGPDGEPGLRRGQSCQRVPGQDHATERAGHLDLLPLGRCEASFEPA